jgi:hypothetical protein
MRHKPASYSTASIRQASSAYDCALAIETERGRLSASVAKTVESATSAGEFAAALDAIIDERDHASDYAIRLAR